MHISILVPVFNGLNFTIKCIERLKELTTKDTYEIIVIDDGSVDGTGDWLSENHSDVTILKGDGSLWWSGSINTGVDYVISKEKSDYILWWNNDIEPAEDYFEQIEKVIPKISDKIVAGSKIYDLDSKQIWGMGGKFNVRSGKKYQIAYFVEDSSEYNKEISVDWLPGMGTLAHVEIYKKVGLIDNANFPQYHGDLDFTLRAKNLSFEVIVYPELRIYNDTKSTGLKSKNTWKDVKASLVSIKSLYNFKKDIVLYKKFTRTPFSYVSLMKKYFLFFAGFFKWRILRLFKITKCL